MLERQLVPAESIRRFALLNDLSDDLIDPLRKDARVISLAVGEILFRHGDELQRSYFCMSGRLKLYRMTRSGDEKIYEVVAANQEVIESIALKPARHHSIECVAVRAGDVLSMDAGLLIAAIDRSPEARTRLRAMLCDHVERLVDHVELLSADRAELRVACYLLDAFRRNGSKDTFRLPSTKRQIASYLSLQPETLSRCLKSLRQSGILRSRAREIEILDADRLASMVEGPVRFDRAG